MEFDPSALTAGQRYKLLAGAILPRPIAVVSTIDAQGRTNVAPFSFFNGISASPMALAFSPVTRSDGTDKDTLRNALPVSEGGLGEFVVNLPSASWVRQLSAAAESLPPEESEFDLTGLTPAKSRLIRPPRILEAAVSYECRTLQVVRLAPGVPLSGNLIIGEIVHVWIRDGLVDEAMHVDLDGLDAIGRLSGAAYCRTTDRFDLVRGRAALDLPEPG
ncbi:MAG: flavin reductase (DIM6/NTAB) family NADH-FMN oxidoreductase RutF [Myxococcota bacterium]|jgi:flavin reductase (DIM6/NTAB) family NADH-FMN oxidoreductase RutF